MIGLDSLRTDIVMVCRILTKGLDDRLIHARQADTNCYIFPDDVIFYEKVVLHNSSSLLGNTALLSLKMISSVPNMQQRYIKLDLKKPKQDIYLQIHLSARYGTVTILCLLFLPYSRHARGYSHNPVLTRVYRCCF